MTKTRKILGIVLVVMLLTLAMSISAFAATTVTTDADLKSAVAAGGEVTLGGDITLNEKITCADGTVIDLNNNTLSVNVENSTFGNVTIKNGSIVLGKDDVQVCDGYFMVNAGKTLELNDVNITSSSEGVKCYAVFHLKTGANLDLINSKLEITNNEYAAGYIVYAGESTATVDIVETEVVGTNVNGIVHATTLIDDSSFTVTSNGTTEHGINRSAVTINNSTVKISGGTGRGITAQHGDLVITGNSTVEITNMGEATIELRNNKSMDIAETATVKVDVEVNNTTAGTITGTVDTVVTGLPGTGTEADPYLVTNLDELKWFRDDVNAGNTYAGKYVKVTANEIDLAGEEWEPIAYNGKTFKGNFNGNNVVIKNLVITKTLTNAAANNGIGFFGRTDSPAVIENITIENVDITGSLYVGAIVGFGYTGNKIENCTVKGNIAIDAWWYAGVIGGNGYMGLVNNCHVIGNAGSYIKGNNGSYIGGIWGFRGEGEQKITNCTVTNLEITGVDRVGGISGIAHYGNEISGVTVDGVSVTATDPEATTVGLIVGACQGNQSQPSVIKDIVVEDVEVTIGETVVTDTIGVYGTNIDGTTAVTNYVASVNGAYYTDIQEAIKAAAPAGTVEVLRDVTVDKWIMIAESLTISNGDIITLVLNGLTIDGNGHTLTINSIESAGNGGYLFFDATKLNINDLTIKYADGVAGGIGLKDGTLDNVTFDGGVYGVFPQTGKVTIQNCTFKTNGTSIYFEEERDGLTVTGNTFENPENVNVILLRGDVEFTNNTIVSGRTVNVVSGSPVVTGNDFGNVRFKVYNDATATISGNKINVLAFNNETVTKSTFADDNILSEDAQTALDAVTAVYVAEVNGVGYASLQDALNAAVVAGDTVTVTLLDNIDLTGTTWTPVYFNSYISEGANTLVIDGNYKTITGLSDMLFSGIWTGTKFEVKNLTIDNATIEHDVNDAENIGVGAIVGNVSAIKDVVINNVKLTNSHVEGGHWTGGFFGYIAGYSGNDGPVFTTVSITNSEVSDSTITGKGSVGGVVGHATGDAWTSFGIADSEVTGNTITSTGSSTNKAGIVAGTIGAAGTAQTTNGTTLTGGVSVSVTESGNTAKSNGVAITTVYGRQGSSTGVLEITGGTYANYPIETGVSYAAPAEGYNIVANENGTYGVVEAPKGNVPYAYVDATTIWGETWSNAKESHVFKFYNGDVLMGTAELNPALYTFTGSQTPTWHINFNDLDGDDEWWIQNWVVTPTFDNFPTKVVLCVDGVDVSEGAVQFNGPDNLNKIVALAEGFTGGLKAYTSLVDAMGDFNGRKVNVVRDVTEDISEIHGVTLTTNVEGGVTVTSTYGSYIYANDVVIGKGVTVKSASFFYDTESVNIVEGALVVNNTFYHGYDATTTVQNGGSIKVGGSTILRYNEEADAGIYIYGDNDDSTVEFDCDYYIGAYSGTFYAENANVETGYFLLKNSYDDSSYANIDMTLDNSTLTVVGTTDTQDSFIIDDQASLTLKNNSAIADVRDFNILADTNLTLSVDETSSIKATNVNIAEDLPFVAEKNEDGTVKIERFVIKVTYADGTVEYFNDMLEAVPYTTNYPKLEGATIKLLADCSGAGLRFMENDMVFDLNGFTYTITTGTGSQGTNTSGFQIRPEVTTSVIFKNGTIKVAEGAPVVWMFNCYATDFVVENVTVDCTNMAWGYGGSCYVVVSRVGDNVQFTGNTKIENFNAEIGGNAINVGGTMTIGENVVVGGTVELDAGATLTTTQELEVVTADGHKVVYNNGVYTTEKIVAQIGEATYSTLADAIANAVNGDTITLIDNVTGDVTVPAELTLIIDLNGYDIVGTINAIVNNGTLTINDTVGTGNVYITDVSEQGHAAILNNGTITINGGWYGDSNNDTTDRNAINRGNAIKNSGVATINGGYFTNVSNQFISTEAYAYAINTLSGGTTTINNATVYGDINGLIYSDGNTVVNDGSFTLGRPNEENNLWYLAYGNVEIKGGTWNRAYKVPSWNTGDPTVYGGVVVSGGIFNVSIPENNYATGYAALKNLDGQYVVGEKPTATVNDMGPTVIPAGGYMIYGSGDTSVEMPLSFVMQFLADQDAEDMANSPFAEWYGDFVITFTGIEDGSFIADGCYLAGHYGSFGWVKVPVDGMKIEEGVRYPVMLGVGMGQKYEYICSGVEDFKCALYLTPAILEANPNIKVNLELAVVDNSKGEDAAASALVETQTQ